MKAVLHSFAYTLDYLREQVEGLGARDMVAQPGGVRNHPAWVIGHLTHTCQEIGGVVGLPPWLPEDWGRRFGTGSVPVADAAAYPPPAEALEALRDARERVARAVERLDGAGLDAPFPVESYREVFPTVRHALTQVLVGHSCYHVGQVGVWRSAMGLPPMRRSLE